MSAPQNEGAEVPVEKKKGFEKYVERFKRAIGKSGSSSAQKRLSLAAAAKPAAAGRLVLEPNFTCRFIC